MAHVAATVRGNKCEEVVLLSKVGRIYELILHAISGQFSVDVWLKPMYPGSAHLIGVALDIRGPCSPAEPVAAFQ